MFEETIINFFKDYAYQPHLVYTALISLMFLSSLGLPIPEEVTLISVGFVSFIGAHPNLYPPPPGAGSPVNPYTAAAVALFAVFVSDYIIFWLGRNFGVKILRLPFFRKYQTQLDRISIWVQKYGYWASGIFRFTPGLRFPGHFSCGMMGLARWKFIAVDGVAALISVPTQILLVTFYGKEILDKIKQFKIIFFSALGAALLIYIIFKVRKYLIDRSLRKKGPLIIQSQVMESFPKKNPDEKKTETA